MPNQKKKANQTTRWDRTPGDSVFSGKLVLPSFGISVTRSDPSASVVPAGWGNCDIAPDSGDAFSVSYLSYKAEISVADQDFLNLDPAYLRRILLRILDGEEYQEVKEHHQAQIRLEERPDLPEGQNPTSWNLRLVRDPDPRAQVRITDLRLANAVTPVTLTRALETTLTSLPLPVTTDGVLRWKYEVLEGRRPQELELREEEKASRRRSRGGRSHTGSIFTVKLTTKEEDEYDQRWSRVMEQEDNRVKVVSFTAAALLLLHDLDMRNLKQAKYDDLKKGVEAVAEIVRVLTKNLDKCMDDLSKVLANRPGKGGSDPNPYAKYFTALVLYRMGCPLQKIARRIGTNPRVVRDYASRGSKNWKQSLLKELQRGAEIEREKFPQAAAVFDNRNDESVRASALKMYRKYRNAWDRSVAIDYLDSMEMSDALLGGMPASKRRVVDNAYIQLGSCLENGIDPIPTTLQ
jgi:hypothetical protein